MDKIDARARVRIPREARAGEVVEIRTLITHPMHNGHMAAPDGTTIARHIINRFTCTFNGETVIEVDMEPSFAANPYIEFSARVTESGTFRFAWHDDNGDVYTETAEITVS